MSAYGGITDLLLEHKKTREAGVYEVFKKGEDDWTRMLKAVKTEMLQLNETMFTDESLLNDVNHFIEQRINQAHSLLENLYSLRGHGHFSIQSHLDTVREMLASIGEAHMTKLLTLEDINAEFIDLTGWHAEEHQTLDEQILK